MSLIETYQSRKQLIAQNLNTVGVSRAKSTDGLTTLANYILEAQSKTNTILTINTPLHLVYTDDFLITGVLTDNNGNLLPNQQIKLKVGSTVVETQTTDTNGTVEFTHTPVRMGNHTFQLVYDGDSNYESALSTIVSKDAEKETTVLNISIPAGSLNVYDDGYFQVSGSLLSDDGERISGKTITVSDGTNNIGSFTTDSNGAFSGSCNIDVAGSYDVTITFAGDNYYTSSVVSRNVTVMASTLSFALSDGNSILSYADEQQTPNSQYATFTATFVGANIVNQAIELYKDNVLWDTLYTDNAGKVSKTYYSQGVGDVEFKAVKGTLVSKTYDIEDCKYYWDMTSNAKASDWLFLSLTPRYSSNGMKLENPSAYSRVVLDSVVISTPCIVEVDIMDYNNSSGPCPIMMLTNTDNPASQPYYPSIFFGKYNNVVQTFVSCNGANITSIRNSNAVKGATYKMEVNPTETIFYENNVEIGRKTCNVVSSTKFRVDIGTNRMVQFKNFKIK